MEIAILILSFALTISVYINWNLNRKVEILEKYCTDFANKLMHLQSRIKTANEIMVAADVRGGFSSDDEIGGAFKVIKSCIEFINEDVENDDTTSSNTEEKAE